MEFTKEEISLCKQVAEKHRKPMKHGDWIDYIGERHLFISEYKAEIGEFYAVHAEGKELNFGRYGSLIKEDCIPLWTISDCLEWLYKKYEEVGVDSEENKTEKYWEASTYLHREGNEDLNLMSAKGKTPLEACLKVVLALLEEEGK